ncbi:MAG: hypothetical protein FWG70_08495 [Oscillospiraceae bacterium]|nr:hypothetical protein [Oscillospiraceae bacterium]
MKKYIVLPLIVGLVFGFISVIYSKIPAPAANWSGIRLLANHLGYLWYALVLAYINREKWVKAFISGFLAITVANITYYVVIFVMMELDPRVIQHSFETMDLIMWTITGLVVGALSATFIRIVMFGKVKFVRYGAIFTWYAAMLFIIYYFVASGIFVRMGNENFIQGGYMTGYYSKHYFVGDIYEVVLALAVTTVMLVFFLKKQKGNINNLEILSTESGKTIL